MSPIEVMLSTCADTNWHTELTFDKVHELLTGVN